MWGLGGEEKAKTDNENENFTFLARGVDFKGIIHFEGTVRVDGRVEGELHTTGALIVGEQGVIKGHISAGTVMTSGKINGTVTASEKIHIKKLGILVGDIRTPAIVIEEGAHFHGMCDMGAHKWVEDQPPPSAQAAGPNDRSDVAAPRARIRSLRP